MQQITRTLKVLLIEDSLTDAILLERVFTRMGQTRFDLERVELLQQGLQTLSEKDFDIILLDLSLPDSWGLESLKKIQNLTNRIPIIVLTGTDDDQIAIAALREGAQDYLIKDNTINSDLFSRLLKRSINHAIERKQIMEKLRHSETLYRGVIEDQTEFVCRFRPNGNICFVNHAFKRYLAQSSTQLCSQNFFLLISTEDLSLVSPSLSSLNPEQPSIQVEFRGYRQQELSWQQWNIRAIFQEQTIVEYQAVGQDISDRKQAETEKVRLIASLQESQEKFQVVTNSAPVLIWMSDAQGKPIFINQFWLDFTGKSLETTLIEDWMTNVHPDDRHKCQKTYRYALQNKQYFDLEYRFLNSVGEYRWIFNRGVPRFNNKGQFTGFVCSGIDISERKQAENLAAQQAKRNYILAEITKHIHESLELHQILQTATNTVNIFLQAQKIIISRLEVDGKFKILSESTAFNGKSCNINSIFDYQVWQLDDNLEFLQLGETIVINNHNSANNLPQNKKKQISTAEDTQAFESNIERKSIFNDCSAILVPIIVEQKLWGIFCVEQCSQPRTWQIEEKELLQQITLQLAIAIKQAELYFTIDQNNQKLQELAVIDSLTRVANRRKFDEYFASEWKRLAREKAPLSLILCDIDYFKLYNDTYGHQEGDICLQKVAQTIQQTVKRPADLTARYGGEEFAVILPNTNREGATKLAQDIRRQIEALHICHIHSPVKQQITLSLGVAGCIPQLNFSREKLITEADQNLYQAKAKGRNCVVSNLRKNT